MLHYSLRIGIIDASVDSSRRSAPEQPFVSLVIYSTSSWLSLKASLLAVRLKKSARPSKLGRGIYSFLTNLRLTASSSSSGRLVAPMIKTLSSYIDLAPSSWTRNQVLILRVASSSFSLRAQSNESISSINITLGCLILAMTNRVFTNFSDQPTHLLVRLLELMLKKVDFDSVAIAFPMRVLPVPGGPNNNIPFGGLRSPLKISGLSIGQTIIQQIVFLANVRPAISLHFTGFYPYNISDWIASTNLGSKFFNLGSSASCIFGFTSSTSLSFFLNGGTNFFLTDGILA